MRILSLTALGCQVRIRCRDTGARSLLEANFGPMLRESEATDWQYEIGRAPRTAALFLRRAGQKPRMARDDGEFLWCFERHLIIALQGWRRDLYFVHAAVLEWAGSACLLVGPSGSGKSTMTWALAHHSFPYLSDELAPIDLKTREVYPYPHALCLKDEPPASYPLPDGTLYTARTRHLPIEALPGGVRRAPLPLACLFFLRYSPETMAPAVRPISSAAAGARLFASALNPLAHPGEGLDGALTITGRSACFDLDTGDLPATCALVAMTMHELVGGEAEPGDSRRATMMLSDDQQAVP